MKVKEGNNVNQANANQKKADISKLPLEKADKSICISEVVDISLSNLDFSFLS